MAKKGQTVQLQTEVSNDEEWEKLLQRDGLIIVDVYSDWCGPCLGMSANLKKLKLEIGGDSLQLAMAKCDNITQLERFRNKSEPTWMFISKGKMMNLMFGADAPKLRLLILDELKLEHAAAADESVREGKEITEFSEEEQVRYEAAENIARAAREKEEAKYAKELKERRTAECHQILENLSTFGVILILPNAREHYAEALSDLINEAGLIIHQTEKVQFTQEIIHELCLYAEENIFSEDTEEAMINNECLFLLVKPGRGEVIEDLHDVILHIVYGPLKQPPGTAESPYHKLCEYVEGEEGKKKEIMGIWTPFRPQVLAGVFRLFFHKLANDYLIPEPEPIPDHLAIVFDHKKRQDALQIMKQYPDEIMHYGFFMNDTTENAEAATLVAKSVRRLEKEVDKLTFSEKLIIQASKKKSECIFAFASLGPMYMSLNAEEGKKECQVYFPDDYADSLNEDDLAFEGLQADEIGDEENAEEEETEEEGEHDEETEGEMEDGTEEEGDPEEEEEEGDGEDMDDLFSVKLTEQIVEELDFFSDVRFSSRSLKDCLNMRISLALLMKRTSELLSGNIDDIVLQVVYGNSRHPPGDEKSPSRRLMNTDEGDDNEDNILIGIWVPQNRYGKAFALKNLFPIISGPFKVPEIEPTPHYVAVGYDAFKTRDVVELSNQFPGQVMSLGFFTSDIPSAAQLIAKSIQQFEERTTPTTYDEKIVIQLAKTDPDCVMAFAELGPSYMSSDSIVGELDCQYFFPKGYNITEEQVTEVKKKSKKKGKSKQPTVASNHEETVSVATSDLNKEGEEETEDIVSDEDKCADEGFEDGEEKMVGADKATSPIESCGHLE